MRPRSGLRETALAALFFFVATIVLTWPIAAHIDDGLADLWDAKLIAWVLHWDYHQTFRDPAHLFDTNIFYPSRLALAFSENVYGAAVFALPLYAVGVSTLAAYNIVFLLGMCLSGLGAWALARYVTGDATASLFAGLVYAFVPWRLSQIPHLQFQWGGFLALSLLFLLKYLNHGRRGDQALFVLFVAWNGAANIHYGIFSALLIALVLLYEAIAGVGPETLRRVGGGLAAAAVAGLILVPLYVPYARAADLYGMERGDPEIEFFSGHPIDFLTAGWQNKLYGPLTQKWGHPEGDFFPGLVALGLATAAVAGKRRERSAGERRSAGGPRWLVRLLDVSIAVLVGVGLLAIVRPREAIGPVHLHDPGRIVVFLTVILLIRLVLAFPARSRFANLGDFLRRVKMDTRVGLFLAIAALGAVVALGMRTPYYRFLVQSFGPIFRAIRAPARGIVLFDLALAVLASWGLANLRRPKLAAAIAILLTAFEYRAFPIRVAPVEAEPPPVDRWLAGVSLTGSVIEWPLGIGADEVEYQFRSTAHWKPLVNGYSGFFPSTYTELAALFDKRTLLEKKAISPEVWLQLERRDCRILVLHPHMIEDEPVRHVYLAALKERMERGMLRPVGRFAHGVGDDLVFEFQRSESSAGSAATAGSSTPPTKEDLEMLTEALNPPFGYIDSPIEEEVVSHGAGGYGWALDDSGVESVLVSFDGGADAPARYGQPHPGPARVYPDYPDSRNAGFQFAIPSLSPGWHVLAVTIVAKDRGRERLLRRFQTR